MCPTETKQKIPFGVYSHEFRKFQAAFFFHNTLSQIENGKPKNEEVINMNDKKLAVINSAIKTIASHSRRAKVKDFKKKKCVRVEKTEWSAVVVVWLGSFTFLTPRYPKRGWGIRESITRP